MRRALITGIFGQDGTYLSELLLEKGYEIFGLFRHSTVVRPPLDPRLKLIEGDMLDQGSLTRALELAQPDEIYNLAAMSFVGESWNQPILTNEVNALGTVRLLEAMRQVCPKARFYQASSSEQFGNEPGPQNEQTPFRPRSPYGFSKVLAHNAAVCYRESYGLHISCGILFNHESPRRGPQFVTRKISMGVARISQDTSERISLGNMEAERDWGFAGDYVQAMWLMLQQDKPDDYVIGTGQAYSVFAFVDAAFRRAGISKWWARHIKLDDANWRPAEIRQLLADASKARDVLGWRPTVDFHDLVKMMVDYDIALARKAA
jgi:GDPmannose 4,6-dehydratase